MDTTCLIQIKASNYFKAIPVIILSGEEGSETRIKCLEAGADDYIVKPFNPRELGSKNKCDPETLREITDHQTFLIKCYAGYECRYYCAFEFFNNSTYDILSHCDLGNNKLSQYADNNVFDLAKDHERLRS